MTVSTTPLRWPDPLAPVLQQAAAAANRCTPWWESIHFADSSELRTQHRHATSVDRAFTAAAHPLLEALVRACWATTT
ncbi:hypothetical protein ACFWZ7_24855 [Nocardiopsis alba]|uniref:hypothetical protein n=1 Tax=Nocardiopsis alba TaxID=53437 RepID=UPI0036710880